MLIVSKVVQKSTVMIWLIIEMCSVICWMNKAYRDRTGQSNHTFSNVKVYFGAG